MFRIFKRRCTSKQKPHCPKKNGFHPSLETLEDRAVPARAFPNTWDQIAVFVDQLPNLTEAQAQFVATHYVGTQKQTASQIDKIRKYNDDFLHIQYRLGFRTNAVDFIHNNTWSDDFATINSHEDWFVHDSQGNRVYNLFGTVKEYIMDVTNPEWRNYYVNTVSNDITVSHADGVFADSLHLPYNVPSDLWDSAVGSPPHASFIDEMEGWYDYLYAQFQARDQYFIPNIGSLVTTAETTTGYYEDVHGAMVEGFSTTQFGAADWRQQMNRTLKLVNNDKIFIAQNYIGNSSNINGRMWLLTNYLLVKREHSYINIVASDVGQLHWWPEYTIDLGAPASTTKITNISQLDPDGDGVYLREFEHGIVLVNGTTSSKTVTIDPTLLQVTPVGGGGINSSGLEINPGSLVYTSKGSSISLGAFSGAVFIKPPLVAEDDSSTTARGTPVVIDVLSNDYDRDGDDLSITSTTSPAHGTITVNASSTITYTPANGFVGTDSFTYTISDNKGNSDTATVTVHVEGGGEIVWVEDAVPAGATLLTQGGDTWKWISSNPTPFSGTKAHQSAIAPGMHQHYFLSATQTMTVAAGEKLFAYVYLDPANPPQSIMLQWNDGTWDHRAYWGADKFTWGTNGTASRRSMGALPAAGQWVRLEVPASLVGLEGRTINGMAFTLYGGRATWDKAGKVSADTVWVEDGVPTGAKLLTSGGDQWKWITSGPAPFSGTKAHQSALVAGLHQHYFMGATQTLTVKAGDKLFAYVYLDPANPPTSIMLQWHDGTSWDHRAYWGENKFTWGVNGTASRRYMGALPTTGGWVRLEVDAALVGLEGKTISGMAFTHFDGRATWDKAGKVG